MQRHLHADFLVSESAYEAATNFWSGLWERSLIKAGVRDEWTTPWMTNHDRDGNPIMSSIHVLKHRGLRIIQLERGDPDDLDLSWWTNFFGDKHQPDAVEELVIACCPTTGNLHQIVDLLDAWVGTSVITNATTFQPSLSTFRRWSVPRPVAC